MILEEGSQLVDEVERWLTGCDCIEKDVVVVIERRLLALVDVSSVFAIHGCCLGEEVAKLFNKSCQALVEDCIVMSSSKRKEKVIFS